MNKFSCQIGDLVLVDWAGGSTTKAEIMGYDSEMVAVRIKKGSSYAFVSWDEVSKLRKKKELIEGDRFMITTGSEWEVVDASYDGYYNEVSYFSRKLTNNKMSVWRVSQIEQVIYD